MLINKKNIFLLLVNSLLLFSCAVAPVNLNTDPDGSKPSSMPSSTVSPNKEQVNSVDMPEVLNEFGISFSNMPTGGELNVFITQSGDGLIIRRNIVKKIENFKITESELKINNQYDVGKTAIFINNKGDGFIFWGPPQYVCIDDCSTRIGRIIGRKIENFIPIDEEFVIDESNDLVYPDIVLKLNKNGNGYLIWTKGLREKQKLFARNISNFVLENTNFEYQQNDANIQVERAKSIDENGNGMFIYLKNNNGPQIDVYTKKVESGNITNNEVKISSFSGSIKANPAISLTEDGNGLAVWLDSRNEAGKLSVYGRYIKNYNPR